MRQRPGIHHWALLAFSLGFIGSAGWSLSQSSREALDPELENLREDQVRLAGFSDARLLLLSERQAAAPADGGSPLPSLPATWRVEPAAGGLRYCFGPAPAEAWPGFRAALRELEVAPAVRIVSLEIAAVDRARWRADVVLRIPARAE